jgi:glycogen debranching enzyme
MLDRHAYGRDDLLRVYHHLERWSGYYRAYRDLDGDGLPEVPMGCDSQDNGAAFLGSFFVTSPDVAAYLALQDRCLARIARQLGWDDEAAQWDARCSATVAALVERLWDGHEFFCRDRDGQRLPERQASVLIMPLCLGALLPTAVRAATATRLEREFLGTYGVASQAFASPLYRDDEYWLGTIWAPLQLLLCDGLAASGREDLARRIATGYLAACTKAGGFYEGFDARSGIGQRAQAYSWSASVALELMRRWG